MCIEAYEAGYSRTLHEIEHDISRITGEVKEHFPDAYASDVAEEYQKRVRDAIAETFQRRAQELRTIRSILRPRG